MITPDLPQWKTIYVDDCDGDTVCDFGGIPNKFIWPVRQTDLVANAATHKYQYYDGSANAYGYLEGF
jgi:hypothetical protein